MTTPSGGAAPQAETGDAAQAGQASPASADADRAPASDAGEQADAGHAAEHDAGKGDGKNRREAQLRKRAQTAEAERDELQKLLTSTRESIVNSALSAADLDPRLLAAAEVTVDSLLAEDGLIDQAKLAEAITAAATDFGVNRPRTPKPNPQQGTGGGRPAGKASWSTALKG